MSLFFSKQLRGVLLLSVFLCIFYTQRAEAQPSEEQTLAQFHILFEGDGFIPFNQSYRINYESKLIGLPIEFAAAVDFPINQTLASAIGIRYRRRSALFISNFRITSIEIDPGVRVYLEKDRPHDLRLFGTAGLLLARSTVGGTLQATSDGSSTEARTVSKDYYNIGIALGLGIEYPISTVSAIFGGLRIGLYFLDPVRTGGLGNAGGVSVGLGYKIAIF